MGHLRNNYNVGFVELGELKSYVVVFLEVAMGVEPSTNHLNVNIQQSDSTRALYP